MGQQVTRFVLVLAAVMVAVLAAYHIISGGPDLSTRDLALVVLSGLIVAALLGALRLPEAQRINTALLVASLGLAVMAAEATLAVREWMRVGREQRDPCRETGGERDKCNAALAAGLSFDTRGRLEILLGAEAGGEEIWPALNSWRLRPKDEVIVAGGAEVVPLGGIASVRTIYCNEHGEYVYFHSDEGGFRNPPGLHSDRVQVVLLGDSFTQGFCVPDGSTIADQVRRRFPRTLNLGRDRQGPLSELATFREYGVAREPEHVFWLFYEGNDFLELEDEKGRPLLRQYLNPGYRADLMEHQGELDRQLKAIIVTLIDRLRPGGIGDGSDRTGQTFSAARELRRLLTLQRLRRLVARSLTPEPEPVFDIDLLGRAVAMVRDEAATWGGRLSFVYLPSWERYARGEVTTADRDEVLRRLNEFDIPVIDIHQVFLDHPEPVTLFPFQLHGHYTEEGYRLVADAILDALSRTETTPIP